MSQGREWKASSLSGEEASMRRLGPIYVATSGGGNALLRAARDQVASRLWVPNADGIGRGNLVGEERRGADSRTR